ncbi:hypothetical protein MMC25_002463 [Agyrium rufum]|nr:hypothetical protein [Agyrium rufum]
MSRPASPTRWRGSITPYLLYLVAFATMGPLQFGYHLAELNTPEKALRCATTSTFSLFKYFTTTKTPSLPTCLPLSALEFGLVTSIFTLGGLLGALSAGPLSTRSGRLLPQRLTTICFVIGALLSALSPSAVLMVIGRFISGLGAGAATVVVPIYISEIAPPEAKGSFGALTQIMTNVGILITQVLGFFLSYGNMWRIVLAVAGAIGAVQAVGLLFAVESPEWLAAKGDSEGAAKASARIKGSKRSSDLDVEDSAREEAAEYESLLGSPDRRSRKPAASKPNIGILEVIRHPDHYRAIIAVIAVMLAQQLCGINSIIMYSVSLLSDLLPTGAGLITIAVGVLNLVATIACAPLADKLGRKTCILISIAGMGVNSLLLAFGIIFSVKVLSGIATLLFVASFAFGLGPIPFILASELVGPEAVGATQSWALAANWTATFVVAQFFPILNKAMGKGQVYFIFAALALVFFLFIGWFVPETKAKKSADEVWGRERRQD